MLKNLVTLYILLMIVIWLLIIPLIAMVIFKRKKKGKFNYLISKLGEILNGVLVKIGFIFIYWGIVNKFTIGKSIELKIMIYSIAISLLALYFQNNPVFDKKVSVIVDEENSKLIIKNLSNCNIKICRIKVEVENFYFNKPMTKDEEIKLPNITFSLQKVKKLYLSYDSIYEIPYNKKNNTKEILYMEIFITPGKMPIEEKIKTSIKV